MDFWRRFEIKIGIHIALVQTTSCTELTISFFLKQLRERTGRTRSVFKRLEFLNQGRDARIILSGRSLSGVKIISNTLLRNKY